jgi:hypothetical protein
VANEVGVCVVVDDVVVVLVVVVMDCPPPLPVVVIEVVVVVDCPPPPLSVVVVEVVVETLTDGVPGPATSLALLTSGAFGLGVPMANFRSQLLISATDVSETPTQGPCCPGVKASQVAIHSARLVAVVAGKSLPGKSVPHSVR